MNEKLRALRIAIGEPAYRALGRSGVTSIGAHPKTRDGHAAAAWRERGVTGAGGGLTMLGSALAEHAVSAEYDKLF